MRATLFSGGGKCPHPGSARPRSRGRARAAAAGTLLAVALAAPAGAEDILLRLLGPRAEASRVEGRFRGRVYPSQDLEGQGGDLSQADLAGAVSATAPLGPRSEGTLSAEVRHRGVESGALLEASGDPLPDHLWGLRAGAAARRFLEGGRWLGLTASVSSESDRPFHSADEVGVDATALYRWPWGERSSWLFLLNYSNTREFWNHVPLPGLAWAYQPSRRFLAVVGVPASTVQASGESGWGLSLSWVLLRTVHARASYGLGNGIRVFAAFHADNERYLRAGREERDERLWYYEKRVEAGVSHEAGARLGVEVAVGRAFDRYYFEGDDFEDRSDDRVAVADGAFLRAEARLRF